MSTLAWIITILGFIATITGSVLAFFTFVSPLWRLKFYLRRANKWHKVTIGRTDYNWQYKNHPEFTIDLETESREWQTTEHWMNHYPDGIKSATFVRVKFNGLILFTELFINLDGGRYFVPVPKRRSVSDSEADTFYWYTPLQVNLARIIGDYYRDNSIEEFMEHHHLVAKDEPEFYHKNA